MIIKVKDKKEFSDFKIQDIYSIRIFSLLEAYGTKYDFAVFYKQLDKAGNITSILSKLDGDYTVSAGDNADFTELEAFFSTMGYTSVLSDDRLRINDFYDQGVVMKTARKAEFHKNGAVIDDYPNLMDIFNMEDYDQLDFESWYVDLSHRIRHGCSKAYTISINGQIISSAVFSSIWKNNAILTSVHTAGDYRHNGFGSALVSEMIMDVRNHVYLMREFNKNEKFYKRLGFENTGYWRMFK